MKRKWWLVMGGIVLVLILLIGFSLMVRKGAQKSSPANLLAAEKAFEEGRFLEAKDLYKKALEETKDANLLSEIQRKIEGLNIKILFSPLLDRCSTEYTVKPSDSLVKIAKEFNTTVELIRRANHLRSDTIRPGQKLKINTCKFSIVVDKTQNLLFLKRDEEVMRSYIVATGKDNSTPAGTFKIVNKLVNPTWFKVGAVIPPDSPENILGSRWMGFNLKGYGIHGTTLPNELGKQSTSGCIRMRNRDIEELYDIVPEGIEVTIID